MDVHTYHCLCSTHILTTPYILSDLPSRAPPAIDRARILPLPPLRTTISLREEHDADSSEDVDDEDGHGSAHGDNDEDRQLENTDLAITTEASHSADINVGLPIVTKQPNTSPFANATSTSNLQPNRLESANGGAGALPSLISPSLRPVRRPFIIRREDGYEKRRLWRCGRCGLNVGYEILLPPPTTAGSTTLRDAGERVQSVVSGSDPSGASDNERVKVMYLFEGGLVETGDITPEEK